MEHGRELSYLRSCSFYAEFGPMHSGHHVQHISNPIKETDVEALQVGDTIGLMGGPTARESTRYLKDTNEPTRIS